jgi:CHC2-type zinc finger protein
VHNVSVLAELERIGVKFTWSSETDIRIHCPFHNDDTPSLSLAARGEKSGVWKCHGCQQDGDLIKLLGKIAGQPRAVILEDLATRYELDDAKIVDPAVILRWHDAIYSAPGLLKELENRRCRMNLVKLHKLGEDGGRITIPIPNARKDVVNVRKYLPGASGKDKMRNMRGRGSARWFPIDQLKYDTIVLCGGEVKAMVAAEELNPHNIGAICVTQGEKLLPPQMLRELAGKVIYVCMDIDEAGRTATRMNCAALKRVAAEVFDLLLPLDIAKYPKGDINDFVVSGGDLWGLINTDDLHPWTLDEGAEGDNAEPTELHLSAAANARYAGRRVKVIGTVSMMDVAPYVVPREVQIKCDRSQPFCALCPVYLGDVKTTYTIGPESQSILETVAVAKTNIRQAVMTGVGVPQACRVCEVDVKSYYNAEDVRLVPQLEITNRASDRTMQPAVCLGEGLELNENYQLVGRMWPNPKSQQSTLLISSYSPTQDALSTYIAHDLEKLKIFQSAEQSVEAIQARLDEIYSDLEANVTRVWGRRALHLGIDLSYHSPLFLPWDDHHIKGWTEILVVGDTSQGKSEAACGSGRPGGLMMHYGLGSKVECKNATVAGLLGGLQQLNGRWFVSWGIIPTNDKRHVILEELKGTSVEVIGKLTDMRSSGIAELPKIEKRRTYARTRLLALSNVRSSRPLSAYAYGAEALVELIGNPEDLRRFDLSMVLAEGEVDQRQINKLREDRPQVEKRYHADLCRSLILWAWTRNLDQIDVSRATMQAAIQAANNLTDKYSDAIPLVDRGSTRHKILRLAAALAARIFSCNETQERLVVLPCHVKYAEQFVDGEYSKPAMGYLRYSEAAKAVSTLSDPIEVLRIIQALPFPREIAQVMLQTDSMELQDIQDWCGWDFGEARQLVSQLVRRRALLRENRTYRKTSPFVALLREALEQQKLHNRPAHIKEKERF